MGSSLSMKRLVRALRRDEPTLCVLDNEPAIVHYTPSSILENPEGFSFWYCNGRKRYATCSGVSWYHENYVACVNLLGRKIHAYRFDREARILVPIQTLSGVDAMLKPENICFSPDGTLVAVTDLAAADMKIFRVDPRSHEISSDGFAVVKGEGDRTAHGVAFSRCGRFVAHTTLDKPGLIRLYRVEADAQSIRIEPFQVLVNTLHPLVPKGIDFAPDGSRVAICFAPNVTRQEVRQRRGRVEIQQFDADRGIASEPLSATRRRHRVRGMDDVRFFGGGAYVVLTQQGADSVLVLAIDPVTSEIGETQTLRNPSSRLSFPHGAGVSEDGRWVAITNYGDDKLGIYAVATPRVAAAPGA